MFSIILTKMKCGICRKWLSGYINVNPYAAPETFCDCGRQTEHDETKIHWLPTVPYCQICMCELPCKCPPQFRCGSTVVDAAALPNINWSMNHLIKGITVTNNGRVLEALGPDLTNPPFFTGKPVCEECGCVHSSSIDSSKAWVLYCSKQCILCKKKKAPWQVDCYYCDECEQAWNRKQK